MASFFRAGTVLHGDQYRGSDPGEETTFLETGQCEVEWDRYARCIEYEKRQNTPSTENGNGQWSVYSDYSQRDEYLDVFAGLDSRGLIAYCSMGSCLDRVELWECWECLSSHIRSIC